MAPSLRFAVLAAVLAAASIALAWRASVAPTTAATPDAAPEGLLAWVATAHQLGVVGYRDPPGALSPDGRTLAYAEGRQVRITPVGGGVVTTVAAATGQVRSLAWAGNARLTFEDTASPTRWWQAGLGLDGSVEPVWPEATTATSGAATIRLATLRALAVSADGQTAAGLASDSAGLALWRVPVGGVAADRVPVPAGTTAPAWLPAGTVGCVVREGARARLSLPCGQEGLRLAPDVDVVGPIAFSPSGGTVYFASPNARGFVDLWRAELASRRATQMTSFARDTYGPSVADDGTVLFRLQSYRTHVAEVDLGSSTARQLAAFQSETPSYRPDGRAVAVTYGTWRRVVDDAHYPDIAQEIGLLHAGPGAGVQDSPFDVIARSDSEDQAMAWSPNGRWIAFHSHREQSDDVWLRPADASRPDRRVSFLGRGAEVGWPRWSPDGTTVAFGGASPRTGQGVIFTLTVNQDTGAAGAAGEVAIAGVDAEWTSAEWLPDSRTLVALGKTGPGQHAIVMVPAAGGPATVVRRVATEHDFPGLAVSPDGRELAFVARASDGWFQVFRAPLAGAGEPVQLTRDAGHKSQPAWAPDGQRVAYTVWSYDAQFWAWRP